jgi:hypothetical protein
MLQSVVKLAWWINGWVFIKSILHRLSYFLALFLSVGRVGTAALSSALCGGGNEDDDEQWDHFLNTDQ